MKKSILSAIAGALAMLIIISIAATIHSINDLWFTDMPPAEYAIVSFEDRTIQPLLNAHPWFSAGNYGIDCVFDEDGKIDLLIHYIAPRNK